MGAVISLLILFSVVLFLALAFVVAVRLVGWGLSERETEVAGELARAGGRGWPGGHPAIRDGARGRDASGGVITVTRVAVRAADEPLP